MVTTIVRIGCYYHVLEKLKPIVLLLSLMCSNIYLRWMGFVLVLKRDLEVDVFERLFQRGL